MGDKGLIIWIGLLNPKALGAVGPSLDVGAAVSPETYTAVRAAASAWARGPEARLRKARPMPARQKTTAAKMRELRKPDSESGFFCIEGWFRERGARRAPRSYSV